ncbi:hypothetical protein BJ742DRAFT_744407 [Cladochytrium replicatum]|nr:hypothetical protein BJ742DRAFT_744407 [Cladochytrium replicatum]
MSGITSVSSVAAVTCAITESFAIQNENVAQRTILTAVVKFVPNVCITCLNSNKETMVEVSHKLSAVIEVAGTLLRATTTISELSVVQARVTEKLYDQSCEDEEVKKENPLCVCLIPHIYSCRMYDDGRLFEEECFHSIVNEYLMANSESQYDDAPESNDISDSRQSDGEWLIFLNQEQARLTRRHLQRAQTQLSIPKIEAEFDELGHSLRDARSDDSAKDVWFDSIPPQTTRTFAHNFGWNTISDDPEEEQWDEGSQRNNERVRDWVGNVVRVWLSFDFHRVNREGWLSSFWEDDLTSTTRIAHVVRFAIGRHPAENCQHYSVRLVSGKPSLYVKSFVDFSPVPQKGIRATRDVEVPCIGSQGASLTSAGGIKSIEDRKKSLRAECTRRLSENMALTGLSPLVILGESTEHHSVPPSGKNVDGQANFCLNFKSTACTVMALEAALQLLQLPGDNAETYSSFRLKHTFTNQSPASNIAQCIESLLNLYRSSSPPKPLAAIIARPPQTLLLLIRARNHSPPRSPSRYHSSRAPAPPELLIFDSHPRPPELPAPHILLFTSPLDASTYLTRLMLPLTDTLDFADIFDTSVPLYPIDGDDSDLDLQVQMLGAVEIDVVALNDRLERCDFEDVLFRTEAELVGLRRECEGLRNEVVDRERQVDRMRFSLDRSQAETRAARQAASSYSRELEAAGLSYSPSRRRSGG